MIIYRSLAEGYWNIHNVTESDLDLLATFLRADPIDKGEVKRIASLAEAFAAAVDMSDWSEITV